MTQIWRVPIADRPCIWTGIDGRRREKKRYIEAIFYNMDMIKKRQPYLATNFTGGGTMDNAIKSINNCYQGNHPVTTKEVIDKIEEECACIEKNPNTWLSTFYD